MRGRSFLFVTGVLLAFAEAQAQPTPPLIAKAKTPASRAATTAIEVHGTIPESLVGTWLAINNFKKGKDTRYLNKFHIYRFSHKGDTWHMDELLGTPPPELLKSLAAADGPGRQYVVDEATLKAVKAALPQFTAKPEAETWSKTIWRSADQFPKNFAPQSQGAKVSIEFIDVSVAGTVAGGGAFYLKDITDSKITGDGTASGLVNTGIAVVPFDINGPLTLLRLQ